MKNGDSSSRLVNSWLFLDRKWNILETYVLSSSHMADVNVLENLFCIQLLLTKVAYFVFWAYFAK